MSRTSVKKSSSIFSGTFASKDNYVIIDNDEIYNGIKKFDITNSRLNVKQFIDLLENNNNITKRYIIGKKLNNSKVLQIYTKQKYEYVNNNICKLVDTILLSKINPNALFVFAIGQYSKNIDILILNKICSLAMHGYKIQIWYWQSIDSEKYNDLAQKFIDNRITLHALDTFSSTLIYQTSIDENNSDKENNKENDAIIWSSENVSDDNLNNYHLRISNYIVWANNNKLCWCKKWCKENICSNVIPANVLKL
jgi:hypothetical protein